MYKSVKVLFVLVLLVSGCVFDPSGAPLNRNDSGVNNNNVNVNNNNNNNVDSELCDNGLDDNGDNLVDCQDPLCDGESCGTGCECVGTMAVEQNCADGVNNNLRDGIDCEDPNCNGQMGPDGVNCQYQTETSCGDGGDNDADGLVDCLDADCEAQSCGAGCICQGGDMVEAHCSDGGDNDGDGVADCQDDDCDGVGMCEFTTELTCNDSADNDADGFTDCADTDCDGQVGPAGFTCEFSVELTCDDGGDNDGDGLTDCFDPDCTTSPFCEICNNGIDDNGNGDIDCEEASCDGMSCGIGCVCANSETTEIVCYDWATNDADSWVDCIDSDCSSEPFCTISTMMCADSDPNWAPGDTCWIDWGPCQWGMCSEDGVCQPSSPNCVPPSCDGNQVDVGEDCDGANMNGATCGTLGYSGGTLSCNSNCQFNRTGCTP